MPSFSQIKDMYRLQKEAKKVKKDLAKVHVEAEGRYCKVVVTAEQEIVSIEFTEGAPMGELANDAMDALNRALKKAQVVAAEKMQSIMKQMGMPGDLTGGAE